jgi:methylmalonyl-CoA/ethylmalonyl-CoA epimerase
MGRGKLWEPIMGKSGPDDSYIDEIEKIRGAQYWIGGIKFELMESTTPDGLVANWIEKNCEGLPLHSRARGRDNQAIQGL